MVHEKYILSRLANRMQQYGSVPSKLIININGDEFSHIYVSFLHFLRHYFWKHDDER